MIQAALSGDAEMVEEKYLPLLYSTHFHQARAHRI